MALFHTNVLDPQIKALPTIDTASGSIATFDTDMTENLVEVKCQIVAQQGGSGTPSPSNPRPITTYTSLNLSHSGADTSNPNVTNIPFGQTVANGVLDVTTGKLRVTHGYFDLSTLTWNGSSGAYYVGGATYWGNTNTDIIAEKYIQGASGDNTMQVVNNNLIIRSATTPTGDFVYKAVNETVIQLDSKQIQALLNENNIWCDTGDTEVKYLLTVGKKIA